MQRIAVCIQPRRQRAVGYARTDFDGVGLFVERHLVKMLERDLVLRAIGDAVEGVAGAQCAQFCATADHLPDFFHRCRSEQVVGAVGVVARPVGARRGLLLAGDEARKRASGDDGSGCFEELPLVH